MIGGSNVATAFAAAAATGNSESGSEEAWAGVATWRRHSASSGVAQTLGES
jgi:hypothetical protein